DRADRILELHPAAVDLLAHLAGQLLGDFRGSDGAEQASTFAGASLERQLLALDLLGERAELLFLPGDLALLDGLIVRRHLQLTLAGVDRQTLRDEVIAGIPTGNILDRAGFTKLRDVLSKYDLHRLLPSNHKTLVCNSAQNSTPGGLIINRCRRDTSSDHSSGFTTTPAMRDEEHAMNRDRLP